MSELDADIGDMGSCVVVRFDKMTVQQAQELRNQLRDAGVVLKVVRNRWARLAFEKGSFELPRLTGKCGIVFAAEEKAITAARLMRDFQRQNPTMSLVVLAGIIEGEVITGEEARFIADMPDKQAVRAQIARAISGPARSLAVVIQALPSGLARCLKQRSEGEGSEGAGSEGADTPPEGSS